MLDAAGLAVRRAVYSSLCNDAGGMIDDLTCFRLAQDRYWLFPTPSRVVAVVPALTAAQQGHAVTITNLGYRNAYLSIQGPHSRQLLGALTDGAPADLHELAGCDKDLVHGSAYRREYGKRGQVVHAKLDLNTGTIAFEQVKTVMAVIGVLIGLFLLV